MAVTAAVTRRIPAGWYPDRNDRSRRQWFDGREWTDYYSAVPKPTLQLVPDLESDPEFKYTLDLPFESRIETPAAKVVAETPSEEVVVEYEAVERTTIMSAITFRDRTPAFLLSGLIVGNVVVVGLISHLI
jgi:hypothetical protein